MSSLPKNIIAFLAITAGILLIILFDPPKDRCDAEIDTFKEEQKNFLYIDQQKRKYSENVETEFKVRIDYCKSTNSPGGCYELFSKLRKMLASIKSASFDCRPKVFYLSEVKNTMSESLELFVQIAWGSKPPKSYYDKLGWLDTADLNLYCEMKNHFKDQYGKSKWEDFRELMFAELPGADGISRNDVWQRMLLSTNCKQYL